VKAEFQRDQITVTAEKPLTMQKGRGRPRLLPLFLLPQDIFTEKATLKFNLGE
jgi:hypothetical protein